MSTQNVAQFFGQMTIDPDLKAELNLNGKTRQERIAAVVELAGRQGFDFTEDECATMLDTAQKTQAGELTDAELEAVAGGFEADLSTRIAASLYEAVNWLFGNDDDGEEEPTSQGTTAVAGVRG